MAVGILEVVFLMYLGDIKLGRDDLKPTGKTAVLCSENSTSSWGLIKNYSFSELWGNVGRSLNQTNVCSFASVFPVFNRKVQTVACSFSLATMFLRSTLPWPDIVQPRFLVFSFRISLCTILARRRKRHQDCYFSLANQPVWGKGGYGCTIRSYVAMLLFVQTGCVLTAFC